MAECCRILAPENLPTSGAHEPVLEAGLENLIFGEEEEYEEYGDSNLRRQLHEELAKEAIVPEKPVCSSFEKFLLHFSVSDFSADRLCLFLYFVPVCY